eukprot:scaffold38579_cov38-Tisochrysis_lutea.AAC.4
MGGWRLGEGHVLSAKRVCARSPSLYLYTSTPIFYILILYSTLLDTSSTKKPEATPNAKRANVSPLAPHWLLAPSS